MERGFRQVVCRRIVAANVVQVFGVLVTVFAAPEAAVASAADVHGAHCLTKSGGCESQGNGNEIVVENEIVVCSDESSENEIDESFGGRVNRFDGPDFENRSAIDGEEAEIVL